MRTRFITATIIGACSVLAGAQTPDVGEVRDRLDAYLLAYEPRLSALVADEQLVQRDVSAASFSTARPRVRTIHSEVAFISLPGEAGWLGFRRVLKVDRNPLKDPGPPLAQLLADPATDDIDEAHLLLTEGARFNFGAERTTNLPNLPLEFLHPRHRHQFTLRVDGTEKIDGVSTVRLLLDETSRPTLIQRPEGGDIVSKVTAWVEPGSGHLRRAQVVSHDPRIGIFGFDSVVVVDFRENAALGMLLPSEMRESFFVGQDRKGTGKATYSNFRKMADP